MTRLPLLKSESVLSTKVGPDRRLNVLPHYFPHSFLIVENSVFGFTDKVCKNNSAALWEFYELSNGGFYMSPRQAGLMDFINPFGNPFKCQMSADALGITACLFVYSKLAAEHPEAGFDDFYWHLFEYARVHNEATVILAAIS